MPLEGWIFEQAGHGGEEAPGILVCEDEPLTRLRLRSVLADQGYRVLGDAANGEEAVRLADELRPDVVLMDVQMPGMDGIEATRRITRSTRAAVLMLTAYNQAELVQRALEAGASSYLVKPIRDEQLPPAIAVALSQRSAVLSSQSRVEATAAENLRLQSAVERVSKAEREASARAERLEEERLEARALAESLLSPVPHLAGYEIATRYEPAYEAALIGGDYFDFLELPDGRLGIVIGDACGKGAAAAAYMARVKYTLSAYAAEDPTPASVLPRLNHTLCSQEDGEAPRFITLVYAVLEPESRRLVYANAGHPGPLLCGVDCSHCRELGATGGLLGALPGGEFTQETVVLEPGDTLALFTDGVTEARTGREMFGTEGVAAALKNHAGSTTAELAQAILDRATDFAGGRLRDDAAVVVLRRVREA